MESHKERLRTEAAELHARRLEAGNKTRAARAAAAENAAAARSAAAKAAEVKAEAARKAAEEQVAAAFEAERKRALAAEAAEAQANAEKAMAGTLVNPDELVPDDATDMTEAEFDEAWEEAAPVAQQQGAGVPEGTADEIMTWVDGNADRATEAILVELDGRNRTSLIAKLEKIAGDL